MASQSVHAFSEKVSLITDGSNPVGRAIALQLALLGSYVIVGIPKGNQDANGAIDELKSLGTLASAVETDASTVNGANLLVAEVEKMFGRLDLLVNTLKYHDQSAFLESTEEIFVKTINENLKSTFFVTQAAIPLMKARPKPSIVNIGYGGKGDAVASLSIEGLKGLTKSLADEFAPKFRINCIEVVRSESEPPESKNSDLFREKSGIDDDDVARTVVYLLSSEAVGLTGQVLTVSKR